MQIARGTRAVVTGASAGIGRAIALALAAQGARLYLIDIDGEGLQATAHEAQGLGAEVATAICDLAQADQLRGAIQALLAWSPVHILVNCAGLAYYGPTHDMGEAAWDRLMSVNLIAPIKLTRALLPVLTAQGEAQVVNICSMFGIAPFRKVAAYQTSKFGLVGFTLALRAEYSRPGFGVTAVCPGFVRTAMLTAFQEDQPDKAARMPSWAITTPDAVAAATIRAIRRNRGIVVLPMAARLMWWLARYAPGLLDWINREGWRRRKPASIRRIEP